MIPRRKKKHFKNSSRTQKTFLLKYGLMTGLVEMYFLYNLIRSYELYSNTNDILKEFNTTITFESSIAFTNNIGRQYAIDRTMSMSGQTDIITFFRSNIRLGYVNAATLASQHAYYNRLNNDQYSGLFDSIMLKETFLILTDYVDSATCEAFASNLVAQGMASGIIQYNEDMRIMRRCFSFLDVDQNCTITLPSVTLTASGYQCF